MITFLATIHILACLVLIGLVLIQDSKGGGVFTSQTSNSVLGATGATSLAQTATKVVAGIVGIASISLSIMATRGERSVVDAMPVNATAPSATAAAPAGTDAAATAAPAAATPAPAAPAANENK